MKEKQLLVLPLAALLLTGCGGTGSAGGKDSAGSGDIWSALPDSVRIGLHLGAGESLFERGLYAAAEGEFAKALTAAKSDKSDCDIGECYTRLGQTYKRLGKDKLALETLKLADEHYEKANEVLLFKVDKRVWAQGLKEYKDLLVASGDKETAEEIATKWKGLRDELGPGENLREKLTQF